MTGDFVPPFFFIRETTTGSGGPTRPRQGPLVSFLGPRGPCQGLSIYRVQDWALLRPCCAQHLPSEGPVTVLCPLRALISPKDPPMPTQYSSPSFTKCQKRKNRENLTLWKTFQNNVIFDKKNSGTIMAYGEPHDRAQRACQGPFATKKKWSFVQKL